VEAAAALQTDVQDDHVGRVEARPAQGLVGVGGLADHLEALDLLEQPAHAGAHDGVVVDDQDAGHSGASKRTRVPPPARGSTSTRPPTSEARSRIPASPKPSRVTAPTPTPSSATVTRRVPEAADAEISTVSAPAWRATFTRAS